MHSRYQSQHALTAVPTVRRAKIMGLYARLEAPVCCPSCDTEVNAGWQFHFGDVSQVPTYTIGDTIQWGGSDRGDRSMRDVIAVAYFEGTGHFCPNCGIEHALADMRIVDHVIQSIAFRSSEAWIAQILFLGPDRTPY